MQLILMLRHGMSTQGGAQALSEAQSDKAWSLPLGAAILGVRQLGLNGWEQQECFALENEIGAWQQAGQLSSPAGALRSCHIPSGSSRDYNLGFRRSD